VILFPRPILFGAGTRSIPSYGSTMPPLGISAVPAPLRRQIQLLDAMSRERLVDVHFRYSLELVDHARSTVEPSRAFGIYARLHHLRGADADHLYQKVLVALGRRKTLKPFAGEAADDAPGVDTPQSVFGQIRRRLRGRQNTELREWVEFHTGRAETELLWAHVENARQFAELLEPYLGIAGAVAVYAESLAIPPGRAEIIYYMVLAQRSTDGAPSVPAAETVESTATAVFPEPALRLLKTSTHHMESRRGAG
jgi:uncharacterized protein YbgA (DUF1722 family)